MYNGKKDRTFNDVINKVVNEYRKANMWLRIIMLITSNIDPINNRV